MVIELKNKEQKDVISIYDLPIKENFLPKKPNHYNQKKEKRTLKTWVLVLLLITFLSIGAFNIGKLINWNQDNKQTLKTITNIEQDTTITEIKDNENTENINEPEDIESDYWYYIGFPLINVDFTQLLKKNKDTVAWINVNNTNINYPVVQTKDNDYYLTHSYDKSVNEAGWVFLDFRNNNNFSDKNTIIYAHSRLDKTMFGSLSKTLKKNWYTDKSNHIIRISTPTEDTLWQIFSIYIIEEESYYITVDFNTDEEYLNFLNTIKNRSKYNFDTQLNTNDKIITLSTCYSDTERTVVHAKLLKKSSR